MKKSNLLKATLAFGIMFSSGLVFADTQSVLYDKDGIKLSLTSDESGDFSVSVENNTDKDMYDVKLKSKDIKGLKVIDSDILSIGTIKKKEKKVLDKTSLKFEIEKKISDAIKKKGLSKTGINGVSKVLIPITIAGLCGVIYVLVKEKREKNTMSLALALALVGTSLIGVNVKASKSYDHVVDVKGDIEVEGKTFEYKGSLLWNDTEKENIENNEQKPNENKKPNEHQKPDENQKPSGKENSSENPKPDTNPVEPSKPTEEKLDNKSIEVTVQKDGKALKDSSVRLFEWERNIPNIVQTVKTNVNGKIIFKDLKKNTKYEIRMENKDYKFDIDVVKFSTNEKGEIAKINDKTVTKTDEQRLIFKAYDKNSTQLKTVKVVFKAVDKDGKPVEGVEFTANTITPKLGSYKNVKSDQKGYVNFELEGAVGGKMYTICVSKNAQFYYKFSPEDVTISVDENGKVTFKDNKTNTFVVEKHDVSYLKKDLEEKIKEAEKLVASTSKTSKNLDALKEAIKGAKAELEKIETIPYYVKGFINQINDAMEKVKAENKQEQKVTIPVIMLQKDNGVVMEDITFELVDKLTQTVEKEITSENSMLTNIELTKDKEYTLRLKENDKFDFEQVDFKVTDESEGPKILTTNETLNVVNIVDKVKKQDTVVVFKDKNLKDEILKRLKEYNGKDDYEEDMKEYNFKLTDTSYRKDKNSNEIYESDLEKIECFAIRGFDGETEIKSLKGLEFCKNLKTLTISSFNNETPHAINGIKDLSPLKNLKSLKLLRLSHNAINNLEPLKDLSLEKLYLSHNLISDITAISNMKTLTDLDIAVNNISNIEPLKNLINLKMLDIRTNKIENLDKIKDLVNLEILFANENKISNIFSLEKLINLKEIYIDKNNIKDFTIFKKLTKVETATIENQEINSCLKLDVNKNTFEIANPFNIEDVKKSDEKILVTTNNEKIKSEFDEAKNVFKIILSDDFVKENNNRKVKMDLTFEFTNKYPFYGEYSKTPIVYKDIELNLNIKDE